MCEDMNVLDKNSTWKLTNLSEGNKLFECRGAFTINQTAQHIQNLDIHKYMNTSVGFPWNISFSHQAKFSQNPFISHSKQRLTSTSSWCEIGFHSTTDHTLFVRKGKGNTGLIIYVHSIIAIKECPNKMAALKWYLVMCLRSKDLRLLNAYMCFLSIEVARSQKGIVISSGKKNHLQKETGLLGAMEENCCPSWMDNRYWVKCEEWSVDWYILLLLDQITCNVL